MRILIFFGLIVGLSAIIGFFIWIKSGRESFLDCMFSVAVYVAAFLMLGVLVMFFDSDYEFLSKEAQMDTIENAKETGYENGYEDGYNEGYSSGYQKMYVNNDEQSDFDEQSFHSEINEAYKDGYLSGRETMLDDLYWELGRDNILNESEQEALILNYGYLERDTGRMKLPYN